jgi:hypothetical protein
MYIGRIILTFVIGLTLVLPPVAGSAASCVGADEMPAGQTMSQPCDYCGVPCDTGHVASNRSCSLATCAAVCNGYLASTFFAVFVPTARSWTNH